MLRPLAVLFGIALLILGILGFFSDLVHFGNLFGIFRVNFEYNAAHLASGILGILCGLYSKSASRLFFLNLGIIYAAFAIVGLLQEDEMIFWIFENNDADNWLHGTIAAISLYLGIARSK